MTKNKWIALAIIFVLIFTAFQSAYIEFSVETQLLQVLTMVVVIIGSIVAIIMFNKGESTH